MAKKEFDQALTDEFKRTLDMTKIIDIEVDKELKQSFIDYAMCVNRSRAIPDVRDGLKPVHRRILYSMNELGLTPDKPYKKCATIVGDVLGKYHPHGDSSVYDALVRLAQDFSINVPLVDGHGNFGSVDGDPAAAYRYTEARMSKPALEMLREIDKETVDFLGFPLIFLVTAFDRNIIISVKDIDPIGITGLIVLSDVLIQVVEECVVFQFTFPECHKKLPHAITDTRLWLDPEIFKLFVWFCKWNSFCYFYRFFLLFSCAKPLFLSQKGIAKKRRQNEVGCIRPAAFRA